MWWNAEWDEARKTKVVSSKEICQVEKKIEKRKKASGGKWNTLTQEINFKIKEVLKCGALTSVVVGTEVLKGDSA